MMKILPIESILEELRQQLRCHKNMVLVAAPGAGKTTRIPLALLEEPWLVGQRILMLEPRRLAARTAARYMAGLLGEEVGETVGYRVRQDTCVGSKTRIEVITEGILTRLLQADPTLEKVGILIFDEFHERSIHADLGLALSLQSQALLREELKIMVMSATLDALPVAKILGDAPILVSEGLSFPVETHYLTQPLAGTISQGVVGKIQQALGETQGDILVFLPGAREIRWVEAKLHGIGIGENIIVVKLYGTLSQREQDLAILSHPLGNRKIILATSIAETSITVEGVRVVVDSGVMRVPKFSPRTGMTHLETVTVSQGAAQQRRGRAGRVAPGVCYRLWTQQEEVTHAQHNTPEIIEADLASVALELAAWGAAPEDLQWLDMPPRAAFAQATQLLTQLGALSRDGHITPHGRQMAEVGLHPRLSHMIFKGISLGYGKVACEMAVLLGERDIFRGEKGIPDADVRLRIAALYPNDDHRRGEYSLGYTVDTRNIRRLQADIRHWKQVFGVVSSGGDDSDVCGLLLAFAYPDRIAQGRGNGRFLLRNGRGATFKESQRLAEEPYLVIAELGGEEQTEERIFLAAPISEEEVRRYFKEDIIRQDCIAWNHGAQAVRARRSEELGALVLATVPIQNPDATKVLSALITGIRKEGINILPWNKTTRQFRKRLAFMHHFHTDWPDVSDEALLDIIENWLGPYLYGMNSRNDVGKVPMMTALEGMLTWEKRKDLDEWAPTHIQVPSGQRIPIDYSREDSPVLAVRLQEMFGLQQTPFIGQGKVPLTLHLLSPAQRPVQVTKDLRNFWENTYFEVKKDLMGRYPKHYWPENPLEAMPTHRLRTPSQG